MRTEPLPPALAERAVFVAWARPSQANRTRVLAAALGIDVQLIHSIRRRGLLAAPLKYPYQALATLIHLFRRRPKLVFVQSPPNFAVLFVAIYSLLGRARYVVDAHSDVFTTPVWSRPKWLNRLLARRAVTTIVTNEHFAEVLRRQGAHASVIRDAPSSFDHGPYPVGPELNVAFVSTFAFDEPLDEVLEAARSLPHVRFRVTGDTRRENARIPTSLPDNVELTGFLPLADYYGLLRASDAVLTLTTRDHTMQRGACEALWLGKPIITSDWPLLRDHFSRGAVHVPNTAAGIRDGVERMERDLERYRGEIVELQAEVAAEWERSRAGLLDLLGEPDPAPVVAAGRVGGEVG